MRALVSGSAERLLPVMGGGSAHLASYRLCIIDGNHLPTSDKQLKVLPGQMVVVYEPDSGLVVDVMVGERMLAAALLDRARLGQVGIPDRHF